MEDDNKLTLMDGANYTGEIKNGSPHGQGAVTWTDGRTYTGEWKNGKRNGFGKAIYLDGSMYTGDWKNEKPEGYGSFAWPSGDKFFGHFLDGKRHGQGVMESLNGTIITGTWDDDKRITYMDKMINLVSFIFSILGIIGAFIIVLSFLDSSGFGVMIGLALLIIGFSGYILFKAINHILEDLNILKLKTFYKEPFKGGTNESNH